MANRVLSRKGARILTPEELAVISGAGTISHTTSGNPSSPSDIRTDSD
jgi:hypothetical protein